MPLETSNNTNVTQQPIAMESADSADLPAYTASYDSPSPTNTTPYGFATSEIMGTTVNTVEALDDQVALLTLQVALHNAALKSRGIISE